MLCGTYIGNIYIACEITSAAFCKESLDYIYTTACVSHSSFLSRICPAVGVKYLLEEICILHGVNTFPQVNISHPPLYISSLEHGPRDCTSQVYIINIFDIFVNHINRNIYCEL